MSQIEAPRGSPWVGWIPMFLFPLGVVGCRDLLRPWEFMWCLSFALFAGLKWLTRWRVGSKPDDARWRSAAYLLAWPGMDAGAFLDESICVARPAPRDWFWAVLKTTIGATLLLVIDRQVPARSL